ncbi:putative ras GTPase-activating protein sar1 [Neoconidiobolus thromboides FSU 785]|nr:putative ras GTPase-activating protein sar1 [Neoconidiobolus thromboides FSU 785]
MSLRNSALSGSVLAPALSSVPRSQMVTTQAQAQAQPRHSENSGYSGNRYSVSAYYSMAAEHDSEVNDDLAKAQKELSDLKGRISAQSKKNFVLERDVRYLDGRIALLIQNRMALDEVKDMAVHLEETDSIEGVFPDDRKRQQYGNLFFLLQSEPRHVATLTRLVSLTEIDTLLQTVMFTLYGNQYESREEHLLLTMFQSVLSAQFEATTEFGSLLRANTPVSRMMTTYTRRGPGQTYLKNVLAARIFAVIEDTELNLEINPLSVYEEVVREAEDNDLPPPPKGVTAEEAAKHPKVQERIEPRIEKLCEVATGFLDTIIESLETVPYGIRWICKQIRSLTKRKYPQASDYSICTLIGAFFFLRFLNPAIVTPQAYMLVEKSLLKNPRRTLTLVAKIVQNLANKPTYSKEAHMTALTPFIESNKPRVNRFLNELCEVGDFYEGLEMDQYIALSKKDLVLNITLNEMFNTHALLVQHMNSLAPNEDQRLRICLDELGPPPPQVPRYENKTVELPLFSKFETPIEGLGAFPNDMNVTKTDLLYMETKSIFVQLLRALPHFALCDLNLGEVAKQASMSKDPSLVRKGIKVYDMLKELEELGAVDPNDNYNLMTEEVKQEITHLGNLREKIKDEYISLETVYKTICDHNNYLRCQLESYKAYLQNVRFQTGGIGIKEKAKPQMLGPYKFSHFQLEKDGTIVESNIPENRRNNIYFNIFSPVPGTFIIALHYKGREKPILEMDLKLDDLLEKQQDNVHLLDLEYVQLNVTKLLSLLRRTFIKR